MRKGQRVSISRSLRLKGQAALIAALLLCAVVASGKDSGLLKAIEKQDAAGLKRLLAAGAEVNTLLPADEIHYLLVTPLYAVATGNPQLVLLLLDAKADPNMQNLQAERVGPLARSSTAPVLWPPRRTRFAGT
jgi:hypothetical protein